MKYLKVIAVILAAVCLLSGCAAKNEPDEKPSEAAPTELAESTKEPATAVPTEAPTPVPTPVPTEIPTPSPEPVADTSIASGTNVALTAEVEVSSTTDQTFVQWGWDYEFVNDGIIYGDSTAVGWTTEVAVNMDDPEQEEWAEFTLNKFTSVNKVVVYARENGLYYPECFEIQVSIDGKNYTTVGKAENWEPEKGEDGLLLPKVVEFDAVTAKYVKFVATLLTDPAEHGDALSDGYLCQIAEIEIIAA